MEEKKSFSPSGFLNKHRADLVLILSLILICAITFLAVSLMREEGEAVRVEIDGELYATYPLDTDGEYRIGEKNILTVKDGRAYMSYADCPDKTCVRTRAASKTGDTIICLPNRISVTVIGGEGDVDLES